MINKKFSLYFVLAFILSFANNSLLAQDKSDSVQVVTSGIIENTILRQNLWLNSSNATGLSINPIQDYGHLEFLGTYNDAEYKASYTPTEKLTYGMNAYGFKSLDKIYLQGGFSYFRSDEDNIDWSLMMDPLRDCPFILADSIGGDWKKDYYKLNMLAATVPVFNVIRFGVGVDYNVSTGGRDNDPRPKATVKDLSIRPSLTLDINKKNNIGLTYIYKDYRQDISVMNKYGVGGSLMYKIMGLSLKEKPITKSSIEYRIDRWNSGLAMQYAHDGNKLNYLTEIKYNLLTEKGVLYPYKSFHDPIDGIIYSIPEEDYKFSQKEYEFYGVINYVGDNKLHYTKLKAEYNDGKTYNLSTNQVELKTNLLFIDALYELYFNTNSQEKTGKFLFNVNYRNSETENLFYAIQTIEKIDLKTEFDKAFLMFGKKFSASIDIQYSQNLNSELTIDPKSDFIETETDITNPYVMNNYEYAISDYFAGNVGLKYYGSLRNRTNYYIGCKAGRLQVVNSAIFENDGITSVSLNVGVLF